MNEIEKTFIISVVMLILSVQAANPRVFGQTQPAQNRPPMFVLQVGISRYQDKSLARLEGSRTDVLEMKKLLTSDRFNTPEKNINTLLDESATKQRILTEFQDHLIENARRYFLETGRRDAVVVFQFSGHGSQVPDINGDEADGRDETFVTYDSQDLPGKNFDITDDEIYELTGKLEQFTGNIIYIFDSCHSGSGSRGGDDSRSVSARLTVPVSVLPESSGRGSGRKEKDNSQTDLMPASDDYIVISAASADQLAGQKNIFSDEKAKRPVVYGFLTYYLIDELRNARDNTTYRELMENVERKVSTEKPSQIPQLEGDGGRFVFGGLGSREDNFVKILQTDAQTLQIKTGAMQGVSVGSLVAVYDKTATDFSASDKIAVAKVSKVYPDHADAVISSKSRELTIQDKAVIGSTDLRALKLKVFLDADRGKLTVKEKNAVEMVRKGLTPGISARAKDSGIEIYSNSQTPAKYSNWDVAVLSDEEEKVFPARRTVSAGKKIFYLAGKDYVPLYNFSVAADDGTAAEKIEKALYQLAHLRIVRSIANGKSRLRGKISLRAVRLLNPKCANQLIAAQFEIPPSNPAKNGYKFRTGEAFWFEVKNNSPKDLYVVLLGIATDGSVKVHFPRSNVFETKDGIIIKAGAERSILGRDCLSGILQTPSLTGIENFKLIVSTAPIKAEDFKYLEMEAVGRDRGELNSLTGLDDWTTVETTFEISEKGSK